MFFAGISGSSTADVAVLSRTVAPEMDREGYDRAFTAALIASASTMANLIPPSIMAVVYGATGNVSIGGLFLGGVVPGVLIGIGLMIYSYFFGPVGVMKPRATLREFAGAARGAALPLVIPVIIMGGILTGWFTPTEAGHDRGRSTSSLVLIPVLRPGHIREPAARLHVRRACSTRSRWPRSPAPRRSAGCSPTCAAPTWSPTGSRALAGTDPRMIMFLLVVLFVIVGDFIDAVPAIIIFMPIINKLTELGDINPVHMGVVIITTLVFGLITPPYGLSLLMACEVRRRAVRDARCTLAAALRRVLRHDRLLHPLPRRRALAAQAAAAGIGRLLPEPERRGLHLPAVGHALWQGSRGRQLDR